MPAFLGRTQALLGEAYPDFEVVWFGHIGDGDLHINVLKPDGYGDAEFIAACEQVTQVLAQVLAEFGGSISAEHGIGLVKKPYLDGTRSAEEIALMRGVKRVFDPNGLLNRQAVRRLSAARVILASRCAATACCLLAS